MKFLKSITLVACSFISHIDSHAGLFETVQLSGMYIQWGYNREWYSRSTIHFKNGNEYDFTLHRAVAKDKPNFDAIVKVPLQISIPQYSYRLGFYLNRERTQGIDFNFDHTKYVVQDYQQVRMTGFIGDRSYDEYITLNPSFLHFEHTDGANFLHFNYFREFPLVKTRKKSRILLSAIAKAGAGIVVPRTDVTYKGKRLNNKFHLAGYIISAETGLRVFPLRDVFFETTLKGGFANYINALTIEGGSARHHFFYGEFIGTIGYCIPLSKKPVSTSLLQ
ncbi:MAG TPA: hypothetical protein VL098_09220 [Flavipsychrobacter sp.]|nr:hypothetical protein [Flavipsychrobacter sp.]